MHEFFIVATPRSDGSMPKLCKACRDVMYFVREEAENAAYDLARLYPGTKYSIFRCKGTVKELVATTKHLEIK